MFPLESSCIKNTNGWSALKTGGGSLTDSVDKTITVAAAASVPSSFTSTKAL